MDLAMPQMPLSAAFCTAIVAIVSLSIVFIKTMIQDAVPSLSVELSKGDQDTVCCTSCTAATDDEVTMQPKPKIPFLQLHTHHPTAQPLIKYHATTLAICSCWVTYQP